MASIGGSVGGLENIALRISGFFPDVWEVGEWKVPQIKEVLTDISVRRFK